MANPTVQPSPTGAHDPPRRLPTRAPPSVLQEPPPPAPGNASTTVAFQRLAWGRLRETRRSSTRATNGVAAGCFLSPLGPRAPPPRRCCLPKEVSNCRGYSSDSTRGRGGAVGAGPARRVGGGTRAGGGAGEARNARARGTGASGQSARVAELGSESAGLSRLEIRAGAAPGPRGAH